ncbi:site-specific DNA-methyltransferase [Algimonas porphyrae]|uniref:site-specific DNA-methyltransferase n=1 Tax=Algimonas porphyrae TaxID=1128113 RepID=UPI00352B8ECB
MAKKQKLELTWVGKDERPKLEPRILIEDPEKSYHAKVRYGKDDIFDNILIKGDNLLALKALEQEYAGKVKCVFIDPPYNTGSAFPQYEDGLEHSIWLSLMKGRIELLRRLMADDGSLWISIDDHEGHYLKVICDEIFGRENFVSNVIWKSTDNSNNDAKQFSTDHNSILVYSKCPGWISNKTRGDNSKYPHFKNPDDDPRGPWFDGNPLGSPAKRANLIYDLKAPNGETVSPPKNGWRWGKDTMAEKLASGEIYFSEDGKRIRRRTYLWEQRGLPPSSLWIDLDETGHNRQAKFEQKKLFPNSSKEEWFATPKPEKLLNRIYEVATKPGDLVLNSFAGSGTSGAVAHKLGLRWIMVEVGDHAESHILPRIQKVIDGEDSGGITKDVNWQGGGGFRYYTLAPSLLETDKFGNWVISKNYNPAMLSEAMCKHMGFTYAPSQDADEYWKHGYSTESDFIYVTTQNLTHDACKKLADEVGKDWSLLICCKAYSANAESFDNLTLVKIPTAILAKCEWGQDDYSLNVENLPMADALDEDDDLPLFAEGNDNA